MKNCEYCGDKLVPGVNIGEEYDEDICDQCWDEVMEQNYQGDSTNEIDGM